MDARERRRVVDLAKTRPILWREEEHFDEKTESYFRFEALVDGYVMRLRINDFPDEPLYSLVVNGEALADFEDDLPNWRFPA